MKAGVLELLRQDFETNEDATRWVTEAWQKCQEDFPNVPHEYPEAWEEAQRFTQERQKFAADLLVRCTLCHTVPAIIREGQIPKTFLETLYIAKPPSHGQPYFMANHHTMVDDTCQAGHGEIRYGVDDKTFCANSGCHGQQWPGLTLTSG